MFYVFFSDFRLNGEPINLNIIYLRSVFILLHTQHVHRWLHGLKCHMEFDWRHKYATRLLFFLTFNDLNERNLCT